MPNILIGIPAPDTVPTIFMFNLTNIIAYTKRNYKDLTDLVVATNSGVRTDRNRNYILKRAMAENIDYILWLDHDMIYPVDIICQYMRTKFDVIGCLYFKRPVPHDPVVFIKNKTNTKKPYNAISPSSLLPDNVYPVDAIGYGGMMVNMDVYKKLGQKRWTHYGSNYHLPYEAEDRGSHDMTFCEDCKAAGYKILVHGSVRAGHIVQKVITEDDYRFYHPVK